MNSIYLTGQGQRIENSKTVLIALTAFHNDRPLPNSCKVVDDTSMTNVEIAEAGNAALQNEIQRLPSHRRLKGRKRLRGFIMRLCHIESGCWAALAQYQALESAFFSLLLRLLIAGRTIDSRALIEQRETTFQAVITQALAAGFEPESFADDRADGINEMEMARMLGMLGMSELNRPGEHGVGEEVIKETVGVYQRSVQLGNHCARVFVVMRAALGDSKTILLRDPPPATPDSDQEEGAEEVESILHAASGFTSLADSIAGGFRQSPPGRVAADLVKAIEALAQ